MYFAVIPVSLLSLLVGPIVWVLLASGSEWNGCRASARILQDYRRDWWVHPEWKCFDIAIDTTQQGFETPSIVCKFVLFVCHLYLLIGEEVILPADRTVGWLETVAGSPKWSSATLTTPQRSFAHIGAFYRCSATAQTTFELYYNA